MQNRREFVASGGAALLAAALARKADAADLSDKGEWRNRQSGIAYRRLGRTGYMISEMVMGGNTIAPDNYEHVLSALDRGLNYLDTAPAYGRGRSEMGYAKVIAARPRDQFFLNTKISIWADNRNKIYQDIFESLDATEKKRFQTAARDEIERRKALDPDYICHYFDNQEKQIEASALANALAKKYSRQIDRDKNYKQIILTSLDESLKRLGADHVDLMMCPHGASTQYEVLEYPEIYEAFEILKKQGKVRALGVSAHNDPGGILEAAVRAKVYSAAMVAYNVINSSYVKGPLERAHNAGLGVIAMKVARPVNHGRNNGKPNDPRRVAIMNEAIPGPLKVPQKAYVWALGSPHLSAVISELVNQTLVDDNLPLAAPKA